MWPTCYGVHTSPLCPSSRKVVFYAMSVEVVSNSIGGYFTMEDFRGSGNRSKWPVPWLIELREWNPVMCHGGVMGAEY